MFLPQNVLTCMEALSWAGFQAYAVGGCVRDALLGRTPHDYDLCTDATPEQLCRVFDGYRLVRSGEKHGTVGVVIDRQVLEITTFRTEGGYRDGRHPDWVRFVPRLEEDLARRDFTVNAMAYAPDRGYIDPFGGREDLENHILRAVGDPAARFTEDALRILRGVRFAVRFGLVPEAKTEEAMFALAPYMDKLARERVLDELCKLLQLVTAEDLLRYRPVLTQVLPELAPCVDFQQHSIHHAYDIYTHTAHAVQATPPELALRWAALLHDIGKPDCFQLGPDGQGHFYGHAKRSAEMANAVLLRLKAPTALREQVCLLITHHMTPLEPDRKLLRRRLSQYGAPTLQQMLALQRADLGSTRPGRDLSDFPRMEEMLADILAENACLGLKDLAVDGRDLLALGFAPGKALGACLQALLQQVLEEQLPNEKQALLQAAAGFLGKEEA